VPALKVPKTAPATASELQEVIGRNIQRRRLASGLSAGDLARIIGHSETYVRRIEAGRASLRAMTLGAIAEALGVTAADLLTPERD